MDFVSLRWQDTRAQSIAHKQAEAPTDCPSPSLSLSLYLSLSLSFSLSLSLSLSLTERGYQSSYSWLQGGRDVRENLNPKALNPQRPKPKARYTLEARLPPLSLPLPRPLCLSVRLSLRYVMASDRKSSPLKHPHVFPKILRLEYITGNRILQDHRTTSCHSDDHQEKCPAVKVVMSSGMGLWGCWFRVESESHV